MRYNSRIPRYLSTYRNDEARLIYDLALRGESLAFVGIAGVGKSNLVNFLRERTLQPGGKFTEQLHFPIVDATYWEGTPVSLWRIMLNALNRATEGLSESPGAGKIIRLSEEERLFSRIQRQVGWICRKLGHQVMFVLDDFDRGFEVGPLAMLERLNGLRSEGNRGFLSYVIFTKRLPHVLGRNHDLEYKSKFYDLFRHNIYALEPYSPDDARQMLMHLNEGADNLLSDQNLIHIHQLAGGHARLLKIVFEIWVNNAPLDRDPFEYFANHADVQQECRRILSNLHEHEQLVAVLTTQDRDTIEHEPVIDHLVRRGVLVRQDPITCFSPIVGQFLSGYELEGY